MSSDKIYHKIYTAVYIFANNIHIENGNVCYIHPCPYCNNIIKQRKYLTIYTTFENIGEIKSLVPQERT